MFVFNGGLQTILSTRKHLFLTCGAFNMCKIILGALGLHLTIPSTRNLFLPLHCMLKRVRMILGDAGFLLNFPSPRNHPLFFLHPAISFFLPYHPLSLVLELESHFLSLSLEFGQKPYSCPFLLFPAGRLSTPSQPYSLVHFHVDDDDDFQQYL